MNTEDLMELAIDKVNPEELVDLLGFTTEELMNILDVRIRFLAKLDRFDYLLMEEDTDE